MTYYLNDTTHMVTNTMKGHGTLWEMMSNPMLVNKIKNQLLHEEEQTAKYYTENCDDQLLH